MLAAGRESDQVKRKGTQRDSDQYANRKSDSVWTSMVLFLPLYISNRVYGHCFKAIVLFVN